MDKNDLKCVFQFELNGKKYTGSLSGSFKELVMTDGSCAGCKHNDPDNTWCFYFNDHAFSGKNCEHFEEGYCRECNIFPVLSRIGAENTTVILKITRQVADGLKGVKNGKAFERRISEYV